MRFIPAGPSKYEILEAATDIMYVYYTAAVIYLCDKRWVRPKQKLAWSLPTFVKLPSVASH